MTFDFSGKAVLVTGAAFGIGRAIALGFARAGASVAVSDVREEALEETVAMLGEGHLAVAGDLSETEFSAQLVEKTVARFGRLDTLICNAADQRNGRLSETSVELFDAIQAVNFRAPFLLAHAAAPHLTETKGSIVNLSSLTAQQPIPEKVAYSSSKAAVSGLTRALAADLGSIGVRVNAIAPGHVMAVGEDAWKEIHSERTRQIFHSSYPLGRCGHPEEVAAVALFLASEGASFITGAVIPVDGGMSILCPETASFRAAEVS